jgi:hypothetical protein
MYIYLSVVHCDANLMSDEVVQHQGQGIRHRKEKEHHEVYQRGQSSCNLQLIRS